MEYDRVFRAARQNRRYGGFTFVVFAVCAGCVAAFLPAMPAGECVLQALFAAFTGSLAVVFGLATAFYFRHRLCISGTRILSQGLFRRREIRLDEVVRVRWTRSKAVLISPATQLVVAWDPYSKADTATLIRYLRTAFTLDIQENWAECWLYYWRAFDAPAPDDAYNTPQAVQQRRRRVTRSQTWLIALPTTAIAIPVAWMSGQWRVLSVPLFAVAILWFLSRIEAIPRSRMERELPLPSEDHLVRPVLYGFCLFGTIGAIGLALDVFGCWNRKTQVIVYAALAVLFVAGSAISVWFICRAMARRERELRQWREQAAQLAAKWNPDLFPPASQQ